MDVRSETSRILWFMISVLTVAVLAIAAFQMASLNAQIHEQQQAAQVRQERIIVLEQSQKALDIRLQGMERDAYQLRYGNR